jgi:hypothetical protein
MAGPIKREQVFNKNVFTDPEEEAKRLNIALDITEKKLKAILDLTEKELKDFKIGDTKDIKKFNEALENSKDAVKDLNEFTEQRIAIQKELEIIEKKRLQTAAKLAVANTEEAKALALANLRLQERNKAIKEAAKDSLGLISAYAKESKRLNDLRNEYKDLAIQNKENTKEGKKLLKNIVTLDKKLKDLDDSVGQNFRSVGKYEKALKGLNNIIGKLGVLALITKGVELLTSAFGDSREGALEMGKAFAVFAETAQVIIRKVSNSWEGFVDIVRGGLIFIQVQMQLQEAAARSVVKGILNIKLAAAKIDLAASFSDKAIASANATINETNESLAKLSILEKEAAKDSVSLSDGFDLIKQGGKKIAAAFDDTGDTVAKAIKGQQEFLELQLRLNISIEQQTRDLAGLAEQRQILQDISDDDTIGFVTRTKAIEKAAEAAKNFAELEIKLAKTKETLTIEAVKQDLRRENALTNAQLDRIQTGEQLNTLLTQKITDVRELNKAELETIAINKKIISSDKATAEEKQRALIENQNIDAEFGRKISDANDEAFSAAFTERREKETEAISFRRDQEEKFRKTERDAFEQTNDIIVEFTEQRIAANETILNSDKATLKERQKALLDNQNLEKKLFKDSINLILEQGRTSIDELKKTIDLRTDLTDLEKEAEKALLDKRKALLTDAAIQKILNEQDIVAQGILIRNLDLGEIEEKVLKDTLKLKQDITEANKEALEVTEETARKTQELQQDIFTQERFLNDQLEDLEAEQIDNEKIHLEERIKLLKEDSIERLELEKELNALLIEEKEKQAEVDAKIAADAEAARVQRIQDAQDLSNEIIGISLEELAKKDQARLAAIDSEIDASVELINKLRQNAVEGSEKALAFQEAQLAKQQLARQREEERQHRRNEAIALAQTFLNQVAEQSKEDPDTAIAEAFKNTFLARAIARGLVGFYEGTDEVGSTGTESKFSNSRDGYVARLDKGEKVFNKSESAELNAMGYNKRSDVIDAVRNYEMGNTWDFMPRFQAVETTNNIDLSEVVASNEKVVQAIKNIPPAPSFDLEGANVWIENRFTAFGKEQYKIMLKLYKGR